MPKKTKTSSTAKPPESLSPKPGLCDDRYYGYYQLDGDNFTLSWWLSYSTGRRFHRWFVDPKVKRTCRVHGPYTKAEVETLLVLGGYSPLMLECFQRDDECYLEILDAQLIEELENEQDIYNATQL